MQRFCARNSGAAHAISTVETFVAGGVAHGHVAAGGAEGRVAHESGKLFGQAVFAGGSDGGIGNRSGGFFFSGTGGFGHHGTGDSVARIVFVELSCLGFHVYEIGAAKVFHAEDSEDEVDDGGCGANVGVRGESGRFKASEGEAVHIFFQGNSVLETDGHGDRETVQQTAVGSAFFESVDEDFSELAVVVFAGANVHLLAGDAGFHRDSAAFDGHL